MLESSQAGRRQPDPPLKSLGINRNTLRRKLSEHELL